MRSINRKLKAAQSRLYTVVIAVLITATLVIAGCSTQVTEEATPQTAPTNTEPASAATAAPTEPAPSATPSPTETPAEPTPTPAPITEAQIQNATYTVPDLEDPVELTDGAYELQYGEGATMVHTVRLVDHILGDLNKDGVDDAAVILSHNSGGTGTWIYLVGMLNEDGEPQQAAITLLGDRTPVHTLNIEDGTIVIDLMTHAESDPMCCPSQRARQIYQLEEDTLALVEETITPAALVPGQVTFDYEPASTAAYGVLMPPTPYDPDTLPALNGEPQHVAFFFEPVETMEVLDPRQMQLRIYPLEEYQAIYADTGLEGEVAGRITALRELLDNRPDGSDIGDLPILPDQGAPQVTHARVAYLDFGGSATKAGVGPGGSGVRFVTFYSHAADPLTNDRIFYTFQGLTNDGRFWISFFAPVTTPVLPDTYEDADIDAVTEDYEAYLTETLAALEDATFTPELSTLDTVILSLQIAPQPAAP